MMRRTGADVAPTTLQAVEQKLGWAMVEFLENVSTVSAEDEVVAMLGIVAKVLTAGLPAAADAEVLEVFEEAIAIERQDLEAGPDLARMPVVGRPH
jgi:hypothetical protein